MSSLLPLLLPFLVPPISARAILSDSTVVHTTLGMIRGIEQKSNEKPLTAFLGVPYGKPPVGSRRFTTAEMIDRWTGELEATSPGKTCYYTIDTVFPHFPGAEMWNPPNGLTEDCLNMNIWVPRQHDGSVIVWIYGGGFFSGSPSLDLYDGSVLAVQHNTIVVNINYRLGPFGFLYLGEENGLTGNMGLLDQQLALKWIHKNIASFGGDPRRVTLFGESAGAASATAHLLAPNSFNYFHKVIAMSGAIVNSWATRSKEALLDSSTQLVKNLNCSHSVSSLTLRCLQQLPSHIIQREADALSVKMALPMTFAFVPVEEDPLFFQGNVFDKVKNRDMKKDVSVLMGSVKDEGTYWLPYYMSEDKYGFKFNHTISPEDPQNQALINKEQYTKSIQAFLPYFGNSRLVLNALMYAYQGISDKDNDKEKLRDGVARFLGDYFFTCGLLEFADVVSDTIHGPLYMYYFTMRSSANPWPRWMGVMHGYEIEYAFGLPLRRPQLYRQDRLDVEERFSKKMMMLWTNFVNTGSPATYWPKYNKVERKSVELREEMATGPGYATHQDVHGHMCRLINEGKSLVKQLRGCKNEESRTSSSSYSSAALLILALSFLIPLSY